MLPSVLRYFGVLLGLSAAVLAIALLLPPGIALCLGVASAALYWWKSR